MRTRRDTRRAAEATLSRWHTRSAANTARVRHEVVLDRIVSSTAMENEPVF